MLLYAYFAKRGSRKDQEFRAQHNPSSQGNDNNPRVVVSDHTSDSGEKSPTSPANGLPNSGDTLSPTRTSPASGLTPIGSHAGSTTSAQFHQEHPDVCLALRLFVYRLTRHRQKGVHGINIPSADHELSSTLFGSSSSLAATSKLDHRTQKLGTAMQRGRKSQATCRKLLRSKGSDRTYSST